MKKLVEVANSSDNLDNVKSRFFTDGWRIVG